MRKKKTKTSQSNLKGASQGNGKIGEREKIADDEARLKNSHLPFKYRKHPEGDNERGLL